MAVAGLGMYAFASTWSVRKRERKDSKKKGGIVERDLDKSIG